MFNEAKLQPCDLFYKIKWNQQVSYYERKKKTQQSALFHILCVCAASFVSASRESANTAIIMSKESR